jgi:hypothetical protein
LLRTEHFITLFYSIKILLIMKKIHLKKLFLKAFLGTLFLLTFVNDANASHFRYASLSWQKIGPTTVEFKLSITYRRSYSALGVTNPNVGDIVTNSGDTFFDFGDGNIITPSLLVTAQNNAEDWVFTETTLTHVYSNSTTYTAGLLSCCRIDDLVNASGNNFNATTLVDLTSSNKSPISAFSPLICVPVGIANNTFFITATDPDGDPLTFSLNSTTSGITTYPSGLTVASNGLVTFNTVGLTPNTQYAVQVRISDGKTSIPVDFIIKVGSNTSAPPQFDYTVMPTDGSTITATPGIPLLVNIKAKDPDAADIVSLSLVGQPAGTTFSPVLPASGNTSSTVLNWTPSLAQNGSSFIVNVVASSGTCESAISSFTIKVVGCTPIAGIVATPICQGGSIALTASGGTSYEWSGPSGFTSTEQNPIIPNALPAMAGTYSVKISGCGDPVVKTVDVAVSSLSVGGTVASALTRLCGPSLVNLTLSGQTGTITGWESQADCTGAWSPIANITAALSITPTVSTCYRAIIKSGVCPAATSSIATVLVDMPAVGGKVVLSTNPNVTQAAICPSTSITLKAMNFTGKIISWQFNLLTSPAWIDIPNNQMTLLVNGASISQTTFYRVCICSKLGICTGVKALAYSNIFKIALKANCAPPPPAPSLASKASLVSNEGVPSAMTLLKAYPTPSNSRITLEIEGATEGDTHIEFIDIMGRTAMKETRYLQEGSSDISLDIQGLANGIYMVRFTDSAKQMSMIKITKEN